MNNIINETKNELNNKNKILEKMHQNEIEPLNKITNENNDNNQIKLLENTKKENIKFIKVIQR